jgi:hypothetical protein
MNVSPLTDAAFHGILLFVDRSLLLADNKSSGENPEAAMPGVSRSSEPLRRLATREQRTVRSDSKRGSARVPEGSVTLHNAYGANFC